MAGLLQGECIKLNNVNIQSSSLKTKEQVISDIRGLSELVNNGKEGYHLASEATETPELKALFSISSGKRIVYAAELKGHIGVHGEDFRHITMNLSEYRRGLEFDLPILHLINPVG